MDHKPHQGVKDRLNTLERGLANLHALLVQHTEMDIPKAKPDLYSVWVVCRQLAHNIAYIEVYGGETDAREACQRQRQDMMQSNSAPSNEEWERYKNYLYADTGLSIEITVEEYIVR